MALLTATLLAACPGPPEERERPDPPPAAAVAPRGFVVSSLGGAIPEVGSTGCPDGLNVTEFEYYGVEKTRFRAKVEEIGFQAAEDLLFPPDACRHPAGQPDPGFRTFDGPAPVVGLDLDGRESSMSDAAPCSHEDFTSPSGEAGVDNQFWRLVGCTRGYRPGGLINRSFESNNYIKEGFPILLEIDGLDDPLSDGAVEVRFLSSRDPVDLGLNGAVTRDTSLRVHEDPRYWSARARGRIEDGVLTTEPVDVRLRFKQQVIDGETLYRDTRIHAELLPDGRLRGVLGFYRDTEKLFALMNDHTIGGRHSGRSAADARGYMCAGMHHALARLADGHFDETTGRCTSISAALEFEAVPTFIIHPES